MVRRSSVLLLLSFALLLFGCSEKSGTSFVPVSASTASSGGSSTGTTGGGSTGGGPTGPTATGPLTRKAVDFDREMQRLHSPNGMVFDVLVDGQGNFDKALAGPSSLLWTGVYAASQAYRYRATGDPVALANMERTLWALHKDHEITGISGFFGRHWGDPAWGYGTAKQEAGTGKYKGLHWEHSTSRDQYTGLFFGLAVSWPHIQDPALRTALRQDVKAVADHLMAHDLSMVTTRNGKKERHFRVDPTYAYQDQLTPQNWKTVDDFPFNVLTKKVPYSKDLADALKQVKIPPVRGGEALRALLFFSVASHITHDPKVTDYYRNELLGNRDFLYIVENYATFLDDLLHGKNQTLVRKALKDLSSSFGHALSTYYAKKWGKGNKILAAILKPALSAVFKQAGAFVGKKVGDVVNWVTTPGNFQKVTAQAHNMQMLATLLDMLGFKKPAAALKKSSGQISKFAGTTLSDAANAMRAYNGTNLNFLAYAGLLEIETDPTVRNTLKRTLDKHWTYVDDHHVALFNTIHSAYGTQTSHDLQASRRDLTEHGGVPHIPKKVDNTKKPGVVMNPWPDRFGRSYEVALDPFPVAERAPHHYLWQSHPFDPTSGHKRPDMRLRGVGYLIVYWLGRDKGFWGHSD